MQTVVADITLPASVQSSTRRPGNSTAGSTHRSPTFSNVLTLTAVVDVDGTTDATEEESSVSIPTIAGIYAG